MLLEEKISIIRKMNCLSQEAFADELGVSRQAISKWENGTSVPDVQMLLRIADFYNLTLDQLVRDEFDLPISKVDSQDVIENEADSNNLTIDCYLGKICDISMNSFRYSVIRNAKIVGQYKNLICFEKNGRYGYFNRDKSLGILVKKQEEYNAQNNLVCGRCTVYVNKGTYFGGNTYAFSSIVTYDEEKVEIYTGKFTAMELLQDISVIMLSDKIDK